MSIFEIVLANQLWARRRQGEKLDPLAQDVPTAGAIAARLAAVLAVFALSIATLDMAGHRDGQQAFTVGQVAASRQ